MEESGRGNVTPHHATIILPTLNEEKGLASTLEELPLNNLLLAGFLTRVLVVDGGSTDRTVEVARAHRATVLRQTGRGKGDAVRQGVEAALADGADYVTVLDADYSYAADTLLPTFSLLAAGTDLVIGVRRPLQEPDDNVRSAVHRVGDALLSMAAARLSRVPFLDICSGLWGVRADAISRVRLESTGFEIEAELFLKMARQGFRVSQVPVTYRPRVGVAKLNAFQDGSRILLSILRFSRSGSKNPPPVSLEYVGDAEPQVPTPAEDWIRRVQALALAVNPPRLSIVADQARAADADELASRLWAANIRVSVDVAAQTPTSAPSRKKGSPDSTPTIRLPAIPDTPTNPAMAVVWVPQSHALLYVPPITESSEEDPAANRSGGYRFRRSADSPTSLVTNLATALHGTAQARSKALLYATAGPLGVRTSPGAADEPAPSRSPTPRPVARDA